MNDEIQLAIDSIISSIKEFIKLDPISKRSIVVSDDYLIFLSYEIDSKSKCEEYRYSLRKKINCEFFRIKDITLCENGKKSSGLDMNIEISLTKKQMMEYCIESQIIQPSSHQTNKSIRISDHVKSQISFFQILQILFSLFILLVFVFWMSGLYKYFKYKLFFFINEKKE
jgi:hypothetical protein